MKQTAVEWFAERIQSNIIFSFEKVLKKAKELEQSQIEDAFCEGAYDEYEHNINGNLRKNSEQYYNEKFKNK